MKQLFKIDESEKRRILEMHENATKRNYLMEQGTKPAASKTCFLPDDANQKSTFLSTNLFKDKVNEVCTRLKGSNEFFVGRYYLVPDKKNALTYEVFTIGGEGMAILPITKVKETGNGWMIDNLMPPQPIVSATLQSGKEDTITEYLKDLIPGGRTSLDLELDSNMYGDYLKNFASIDPNFKQVVLKYKNFSNYNNEFINELVL